MEDNNELQTREMSFGTMTRRIGKVQRTTAFGPRRFQVNVDAGRKARVSAPNGAMKAYDGPITLEVNLVTDEKFVMEDDGKLVTVVCTHPSQPRS